MINITTYSEKQPADGAATDHIVSFLHKSLEQYGDPADDIRKAISYAFGENGKPGGVVLTAENEEGLVGAVVVNKTGMQSYIPENILVYIATDPAVRGQGFGKKLMQAAIAQTEGAVALHCEPDNPARHLYEKLGFTSKYLEMRLQK